MNLSFFSLVLTIFSVSTSFCQQEVTLYLNDNWELTTSEKSTYKREAKVNLKEMTLDGSYKDYDKKGKLSGDGTYSKGTKTGIHRIYKDETLVSAIEYTNNEFIIKELADPNGNKMVINGTGKFTIPYIYFEYYFEIRQWMDGILTGEFQDGKRVGKWTYNGKHDYEEFYEGGVLIKITAKQREIKHNLEIVLSPTSQAIEKLNFDNRVFKNLYSYFEVYPIQNTDTLQRHITYPGGIPKLMDLISQNLKFPKEDRMNKIQGKVIVSIRVDEHGNVKSYKITKPLSPTYDEEALRVIKLFEKKLCPALYKGKAHESIISIPIEFRFG